MEDLLHVILIAVNDLIALVPRVIHHTYVGALLTPPMIP